MTPAGVRAPNAGFTLIETLVAIAILAAVVLHFLGTRTTALIDAADARNWRIAREIAERQLSVIQAGAHELAPENRAIVDLDDEFPGFRYQVLIGEAAIAEAESDIADEGAQDSEAGEDNAARLEWQRERDMLRSARSQGVSFTEYEDQQRAEELEERIPSEDEFEDIAVIVYFPDLREQDTDAPAFSTFMLKAKVSTMAIDGLTPEEAQVVAESRGLDPTAASASATPNPAETGR